MPTNLSSVSPPLPAAGTGQQSISIQILCQEPRTHLPGYSTPALGMARPRFHHICLAELVEQESCTKWKTQCHPHRAMFLHSPPSPTLVDTTGTSVTTIIRMARHQTHQGEPPLQPPFPIASCPSISKRLENSIVQQRVSRPK